MVVGLIIGGNNGYENNRGRQGVLAERHGLVSLSASLQERAKDILAGDCELQCSSTQRGAGDSLQTERDVLDESPPSVLPDLPKPGTAGEEVGVGSSVSRTLPVVERAPNSIEGIICSFDWDCAYWIGVARCESSLQPSAIGWGGQYVGLYQVWLAHGYGSSWLLDPYNNTLAAWELSNEGKNTTPWPCCRFQ